jgi:hypothetical protein
VQILITNPFFTIQYHFLYFLYFKVICLTVSIGANGTGKGLTSAASAPAIVEQTNRPIRLFPIDDGSEIWDSNPNFPIIIGSMLVNGWSVRNGRALNVQSCSISGQSPEQCASILHDNIALASGGK